MAWKMSQDLVEGDRIKISGYTMVLDTVARDENLPVQLTGHMWISPKLEFVLTIPRDIPVKTPKKD